MIILVVGPEGGGWKCGVGILGETEGGKARFLGGGGEMGRVERP